MPISRLRTSQNLHKYHPFFAESDRNNPFLSQFRFRCGSSSVCDRSRSWTTRVSSRITIDYAAVRPQFDVPSGSCGIGARGSTATRTRRPFRMTLTGGPQPSSKTAAPRGWSTQGAPLPRYGRQPGQPFNSPLMKASKSPLTRSGSMIAIP